MASKTHSKSTANDFGIINPTAGATSKEDWIGSQLKKVYDEALSENIPDDMLQLLSSLDDNDPKEDSADEEAAE
ncbi:NepR family anti-sigma factor [uncultured Roseibium sp.]|uniref:NepR family anti-sigma factor n=1 Tax=uncultured Roseibium sp. TaxID=1936171 RepID=UPI0026345B14|nr:NepR family anti-sigma factor [uncultured Roseibium sp.]